MWTGGTLGTGLSYNDFFLAVLFGNLLLGIYTAFLGYIGAKTGLSTHLLARYSFGIKGSWLPSMLLGGTQVGWFGVGVAMFAIPVSKATGIDVNILIAVSGLLMTMTIFFGISALTILSIIAVPAIVILGSYSVWLAVDGVGGLDHLKAMVPQTPLNFSGALALVVGSFISAGTLTADFVRFGRNAKGAVVVAMVAFFLGNSLMFIFGAAGAAAVGQADISDVMIAQGLLLPAIIVLGLNIWTTNDNALYASGLGFANVTGLSSRTLSVVNGIIGTLCALWLYNNFVGWLTFLSAAIPPVGGVIIADYLINRRRYASFHSATFVPVNWVAILSVALGVAAGNIIPGIVPVNAVLGGVFSYLLLTPLSDVPLLPPRRLPMQNNTLTIRQARLQGQEGLWQIAIENGRFSRIEPQDAASSPVGQVLDAEGGLIIPPFVEPHIHLDTTQTAGEPSWNQSGTLFEGIERWAERKALLTHEDVKTRAMQTLKWQMANGIQHVRTHVDVSDPTLTALKAMLEVKQEVAPWVDLQIVAFPQEGILSYPNGEALLEEAVRMGADVIGAIPHFEFTREYGVESLHKTFALAQKYDRLIDVHCDEIDDEQSRFVETVAALAHRDGMGARVTASHTTAMHSYNGAYASRLFRLLKMSGINFVANPLVNIHLQGRFDTYPKRRGVTRVKEMLEAGINVCFGHDDVFDPWYPLGTANMLQVLHMGLHVCQLMGYGQINDGLNLITTHSAKTLNLQDYGVKVGNSANLVVLPAENGFDAVRRQTPARYSVRHGRVIAETVPSQTTLHLTQPEAVTFKR